MITEKQNKGGIIIYNQIAVISPSSTLTTKMKVVLKDNNLDFIVKQASSKDAVHEAQRLVQKGIKVIISRGATAKRLRNNVDIPIVDITHSFMDCYSCYKKAKKYSNKIAFLASSEGYEQTLRKYADFLKDAVILNVDTLLNDDEMNKDLNQLSEMGIEVAIGGLSMENHVKALGIKYIMSEADTDSILNSVDEALHLLKIEKEREERNVELQNRLELNKSILNCVSEGIISYGNNGIIRNLNHTAKIILGASAFGKHIEELIPNSIFMDCINKKISVTGEIVSKGKQALLVSIEPVIVDGKPNGAVATLQKPTQIEEMEHKIRAKLLNKGHISDKTFDDIIGSGATLNKTKQLAKKYASVDSTVLILGDTGTGKELFAQSIHNESKRKTAPFVAINCAAFPPSVLESELFGYVKGAFTGALNEGKAGIFELAHKGTIFLDEISETPLDVQLKLLRVIQERKIIRIGDDKVIPIDVRIITASNKDLKKQIEKNLFREDFYYRICVLELKIPALAERCEDIPALVFHFLENSPLPPCNITNKALDLIANAHWPGNIRQLNNILERLMVVCENGMIDCNLVQNTTDLYEHTPPSDTIGEIINPSQNFLNQPSTLTEKEYIRQVLVATKGNRKLAAKKLGISITTLWRRIKKITSTDEHFLDLMKYQ